MIGAAFFLAAATTGAGAPATVAAPITEIFEQVCVDGAAQFAPDEIQAVKPGKIPQEARQLAMLTLWLDEYDYGEHRFALGSEMPSRVYRLSNKDEAYLIVADEAPSNPIQSACAILIEDDQYEELAKFAASMTESALPDLKKTNAMVSFSLGDHRISVATMQPTRWTMISANPIQFSPASEPIQ